jgi:carotenoid cleavage dioxygenase
MFVVERRDLNVSNLVIVDTRDFETPIAVAELPLRVRPQIHGNWVDARDLNNKPLVAEPGEIKLSGKA